jgi:hypothetical protein
MDTLGRRRAGYHHEQIFVVPPGRCRQVAQFLRVEVVPDFGAIGLKSHFLRLDHHGLVDSADPQRQVYSRDVVGDDSNVPLFQPENPSLLTIIV